MAVVARPVSIASAVRLDLVASHEVNCLALQAHSGSRPAAIATVVRLISGLAVVQAEFCIHPVCLAPGPWLFFVLVLVALPLTRPPCRLGPSIVMWRSTGTPCRAPGHPATDRRTDGTAQHTSNHVYKCRYFPLC